MNNYAKYLALSPLEFHEAIDDRCQVEIHLHDVYEIFQAQSNNIRYFVEGNAYEMKVGDIIVTSSREIHKPVTIDDQPYVRRFIQFDPRIIQSYLDLDYNPMMVFENRTPGIGNHLPLPTQALTVIDGYFKGIKSAAINHSHRSLYESRLILVQLLMELETLYTSVNPTHISSATTDERIVSIRKYLDLHFTDPFDLTAFSKQHLMDKYYLSHLFKENTGFTLLEYIQSKRIQKAKSLLNSDLGITEISRLCGYDDYSNFYKTFTKLVKASPYNYRLSLAFLKAGTSKDQENQ